MPAEDRAEFLKDLGLEETGLARIIRAGYDLLHLITFFTAGPKEARAWTVEKGAKAPQAAGVIHTDFERGFIRAETIAFDDFVACGGETGRQGCRQDARRGQGICRPGRRRPAVPVQRLSEGGDGDIAARPVRPCRTHDLQPAAAPRRLGGARSGQAKAEQASEQSGRSGSESEGRADQWSAALARAPGRASAASGPSAGSPSTCRSRSGGNPAAPALARRHDAAFALASSAGSAEPDPRFGRGRADRAKRQHRRACGRRPRPSGPGLAAFRRDRGPAVPCPSRRGCARAGARRVAQPARGRGARGGQHDHPATRQDRLPRLRAARLGANCAKC